MTKEERYLLLRDSFARVPYGVKGVNEYGNIITLKDWKTEQSIFDGIRYIINKYSWRPYLFPLSSMTEKQKKELNILRTYVSLVKNKEYLLFDWLNANHFDYRGLIDMGLAIDATNLNIY
jgi:hypothetical protein